MKPMRQAGLTLIELMVVVAIVGFLMVVAVVTMSSDPSVEDVSNQLSNFIGEAARKSVAGGAIDHDSCGFPCDGDFARTRVLINIGASGGGDAVLERYEEGNPPVWNEIGKRYLSSTVEIVGYRSSAALAVGTGVETAVAGGDTIEIHCIPDGGCRLEPPAGSGGLTIYLREKDNPSNEARLVLLPLRGVPMVLSGW